MILNKVCLIFVRNNLHISNLFTIVEGDVEHIKPLSKTDMKDFYSSYIVPSSSTRAKLSIHMVGQATPLPTTSMDQALVLIAEFLQARGVPLDEMQLVSRFQEASISNNNMGEVVAVMKTYLTEDAKIDEKEVDTILSEGMTFMQAAATKENNDNTGTATSKSDDADGKSKEIGTAQSPITPALISDAHAWKTSMTASSGPQPVKDLSEFEESEPKL